MNKIYKILCVLCVLGGAFFSANAQTRLTSRVLLIPLDDRPPCLQMPVKMGLIGDVEVVTPPRNLLGRFTEFGKSDEIIKWLKKQNLKSFDAAIISLDMLAYGGLVAMREYETTESEALKRVDFIRQIRKIAPKMPIYGSSVIMRLAPTGNVVNESYRTNLAKWAEISVDESKRAETAELENKIPAEALEKYKKARQRDLKINLYSVELVRDKVIDYLILSQDDAKPNGVHIADREKLIEYVKTQNLGEKVAIQPGADEVSMLLLARTMTDKYKYRPKIKAIYSDEKIADQFMPYEDRPLRKTVSFHIKAVGATEVENEKDADILFYVFVSRFESGKADKFAKEITDKIISFNKIIVADVDVKGEVQGGDVTFTNALLQSGKFSQISGYAAWNTAGNTIGTALPNGVVFETAMSKYKFSVPNMPYYERERIKDQKKAVVRDRIIKSNVWFLINRLLDDFVYHSIVRPKSLNKIRENKWNSLRLDQTQTNFIEKFSFDLLKTESERIIENFAKNNKSCSVKNLTFDLPWNRTFEAEINYQLLCK
jgi:hypothetical protein